MSSREARDLVSAADVTGTGVCVWSMCGSVFV